jgi:predicted enzyme related to lactoylglutathione lyase
MITKDPETAATFYGELFGWRVDRNNALGYRAVDTCSEQGISGGIWPAPPEAPSFVQLFVEVADVAETIAKATARGASIVVPLQKLPDGDEMAVLRDPNGCTFGLMRGGKD